MSRSCTRSLVDSGTQCYELTGHMTNLMIQAFLRIQPSPPQNAPRDVLSRSCFARRSARGAKIDLALGQRGQLLVGRLFLVQRLLQHAGAIVAPKLLCPCDQSAAAHDLAMLRV